MKNEPRKYNSNTVIALAASLLAVIAYVPLLLLTDHRIVSLSLFTRLHFLLGENASRFITDLPIAHLYAKLWPMYSVFAAFLITITYYEFKKKIIPDAVTLPGLGIGVGFVASFGYIDLIDSLLGVAVSFGGLWALNRYWQLTRGQFGIGSGDIKMQAMIGAFLGLQNSIVALGIAATLAAIYIKLFRRRSISENLEFGPWLALAALVCTLAPVSWQG